MGARPALRRRRSPLLENSPRSRSAADPHRRLTTPRATPRARRNGAGPRSGSDGGLGSTPLRSIPSTHSRFTRTCEAAVKGTAIAAEVHSRHRHRRRVQERQHAGEDPTRLDVDLGGRPAGSSPRCPPRSAAAEPRPPGAAPASPRPRSPAARERCCPEDLWHPQRPPPRSIGLSFPRKTAAPASPVRARGGRGGPPSGNVYDGSRGTNATGPDPPSSRAMDESSARRPEV